MPGGGYPSRAARRRHHKRLVCDLDVSSQQTCPARRTAWCRHGATRNDPRDGRAPFGLGGGVVTAPFRITVTIEAPAELVDVAERLVGALAGLHGLLACLNTRYQRGGDAEPVSPASDDAEAAGKAEGHAGGGVDAPAPPVTEESRPVVEQSAPVPSRSPAVTASAAVAAGRIRLNDVPSVAHRQLADDAIPATAAVTWPDAEIWARQHAKRAMETESRRGRLAIINQARREFFLPPFSIVAERASHGVLPVASLG